MEINEMKTSRNNIMHQIQTKIREKKEKELGKMVSEIEVKDNAKVYKVIR